MGTLGLPPSLKLELLTVHGGVPVAGVSRVEARAGFLHHSTSHCRNRVTFWYSPPYRFRCSSLSSLLKCRKCIFLWKQHSPKRTDVFIRLALFDQQCEAALHDAGGPFVHLTLAVVVGAHNGLDTLRQTHNKHSVYSHVVVSGSRFTPRRLKWRESTVPPQMFRYLFIRFCAFSLIL